MKTRGSYFGKWLSTSMQAQNVSQAELARQLGVADAQVSRWRRGLVVPSPLHLNRIAAAFDVPAGEIAQLTEHVDPVDQPPSAVDGDPTRWAEQHAVLQGLAAVLEERVPRHLWPTYVKACEVLADEMIAAFERALAAGEPEHRRTGFHVGDEPC